MVLRSWYKVLLFTFLVVASAVGQPEMCLNPQFQTEIDSYLSYDVPVISVTAARASQDSVIFLDAREAIEYNTSHIKDAIYVGYDDFDMTNLEGVDKSKKIIIYCSIGYRSEKIGKKLKKAGFSNVNNLYGSIFEWVNQKLPVYNALGLETNEVHTYNKKWSKWIDGKHVEKVWD